MNTRRDYIPLQATRLRFLPHDGMFAFTFVWQPKGVGAQSLARKKGAV